MAKILVIDDSNTDRALMKGILDGHEVLEATNGDEGFTMAVENHPELVFLDVVMPGRNGFQICRDLRRESAMADVPIIMLTSKNQQTDKEWGMRQGATEYLTKPYSDDDVLSIVKQYL